MNLHTESKQKIEPEHYYRGSYKRIKNRDYLYKDPRPQHRLAGTYLGPSEEVSKESERYELIGAVAACCLIVTIITLGVAVHRFGGLDNQTFLASIIKTLLFLPLPIMMLRYQTKSTGGDILRVCGLIVPVAISVMSCILCCSEPVTEQGIQSLYHIRLLAFFGTIAYALLQTIVRCAYYFYNKHKQD